MYLYISRVLVRVMTSVSIRKGVMNILDKRQTQSWSDVFDSSGHRLHIGKVIYRFHKLYPHDSNHSTLELLCSPNPQRSVFVYLWYEV